MFACERNPSESYWSDRGKRENMLKLASLLDSGSVLLSEDVLDLRPLKN